MKPDTKTAMQNLISEVRRTLPLDASVDDTCTDADDCNSCSLKLLEYLNSELEYWEARLAEGVTPNFGDINKLAKSSRKIYTALEKNSFFNS